MAGELITQPWQVDWNGFLLGTSTVYRMQQLDGWEDLPGLDMGAVSKPSRHGAWPGRPLAKARIVTLSMQVVATADQMADSIRDLRIATAVSPNTSEAPLVIRLHDETFLAFGKISGRAIPVNHAYSQGMAPIATLQWLCADSRRYELDEQSLHIAGPTGVPGLQYPLTYPLDYGGTVTPSSANAINNGNEATNPLIAITGPCTNPRITNAATGHHLAFAITLAADETLVIDTNAGTVRLGATDKFNTWSGVPPEDFVLIPGINSLTFEAPVYTSDAGVDVTWRSAWL